MDLEGTVGNPPIHYTINVYLQGLCLDFAWRLPVLEANTSAE